MYGNTSPKSPGTASGKVGSVYPSFNLLYVVLLPRLISPYLWTITEPFDNLFANLDISWANSFGSLNGSLNVWDTSKAKFVFLLLFLLKYCKQIYLHISSY